MLTKSLDEQNCPVVQNDICSSKEAHKHTNETTSRDEPTIKSSPPLKATQPTKEAGKSSPEVDLSLPK